MKSAGVRRSRKDRAQVAVASDLDPALLNPQHHRRAKSSVGARRIRTPAEKTVVDVEVSRGTTALLASIVSHDPRRSASRPQVKLSVDFLDLIRQSPGRE